VRTLKTFQGTHILGASRGLLCDSYAVLFFQVTHIFGASRSRLCDSSAFLFYFPYVFINKKTLGKKRWETVPAITIQLKETHFFDV